MMNKIEKLLDLCIKIAETHLDAAEKKTHPMLPFPAAGSDGPDCETQTMTPNPPAEKKTRKPRAAKEPVNIGGTSTPAEKAANEAEFRGDGSSAS